MTRRNRGPWSFPLDFERAPRGLSLNDRPKHWSVKAASTAQVRTIVMARVRALHVPALERCQVDIVWVVGDRRRRDTDNLAPFMKAVFDGVGADRGISARIVEDDDPAHMVKPGATIQYVKGVTAHFIVTITDLGAADA